MKREVGWKQNAPIKCADNVKIMGSQLVNARNVRSLELSRSWEAESELNRQWVSENRAPIAEKVARSHRKPDTECSRHSQVPKHVAYWKKFDDLCQSDPKWDEQSPRWEYLRQAFPMYRTLNSFTADLRLRQISVHMAIAEKVDITEQANKAFLLPFPGCRYWRCSL
jgi:hypothetical protein